jgi:cytochrome c-type biogenesis protein CcmE
MGTLLAVDPNIVPDRYAKPVRDTDDFICRCAAQNEKHTRFDGLVGEGSLGRQHRSIFMALEDAAQHVAIACVVGFNLDC